MTSKENLPPGDLVGKNTPTKDGRHEDKVPTSDQESLPRLMGPLAIRSNNISCPPSVEDLHSPEVAKRNEGVALSIPEGSKLDRDNLQQENPLEQSDDKRSVFGSASGDDLNNKQDDEENSDFDFDDNDISIDDDPFFGDAGSEVAPSRPTEEQMDAIQKTMEEDEKAAKQAYEEKLSQEAIGKVLEEDVEPPALISNDNDVPDPIVPPHALLTDQNYNAKEMLISIRSSFAGDVFHIVGVTEPLGKMKMKFVQAVNMRPSELGTLEFLCGYHVIQDDDTVEKVCCSPHRCSTQVANAAVAHDRT